MNSILIPESLLHEKTYNADKYFNERFPSDYATMEANPNYSESGCGIAVTASDTENTLSIKDPADSSKELCKLTYSNGKLKFTYKKPAMVNNITMVGVGSTEKLNILDNNFDILHLNVVKKLGGTHEFSITNNLRSIDYGNGKLAVAGANCAGWSTDGTDLTISSSTISGTIYSVCYGNGTFVATGNSSTAYYSTDGGATWTATTMPTASTNSWTKVAYGNGKFVTVSNGTNVCAYSTDGKTWTAATMPSTGNWQAMTYGNGKFVCLKVTAGSTETKGYAYSTNGTSWTEGVLDDRGIWRLCCYGNDRFVIIAFSNNKFGYSLDGINWTYGDMLISSPNYMWSSICYGNGKFVVASQTKDAWAYSYNGYKWYLVNNDKSFSTLGICYYPDKDYYVAVGNKTMRIISIPDAYAGGICNTFAVEYSWSGTIPSGVTLPNPTSYASGATVTVDTKYTSDSIVQELGKWTMGNMSSSQKWQSVCYGNGKFIAVTDDSDVFAYSTDGITWNSGTMPSSQDWQSVCYGNGKYIAIVWSSNIFAYSSDGINWTQGTMPSSSYWESVCYGNGKYVSIAYGSNVFAYSTDGITWNSGTMPSSQNWRSVCYGKDKFVAIVIDSDVFAYSTDGITWNSGTMPSSQSWCSVCYGSDKFVAIASGTYNFAYSTDGITWTSGTLPNNYNGYSICYGNGNYMIISNRYDFSKVFAYSSDGINWTQGTIPSQSWYSVCYGDGKFVAITFNSITSAYLTLPDTYYSFSGWNKSGTFNITSDTSITGRWTQKSKLSVTYSWTNAPTGMTSTVPAKVTGLMPNETVVVDSKYTNKSAYKDTTNKKYYKFSGWNKSGEFNITSNTSISGSWDNGTNISSIVDLNSLIVGSTFTLGKYQVESETPWPIEWEIVHQTDDYQIAMTKQIIDLRPFDGKEPTNTDSSRKYYGNNNWQYSNIKQFLNSDKESWYSAQHQYDAPPNSSNVDNSYNAYDTHKGFLYYWSNDEKSLLKDMTLTLANNTITDGGGSYTWTGKVWLPTYTQMSGSANSANDSIHEGEGFSKFTSNSYRIKYVHDMVKANNEYAKNLNIDKNWYYLMSSASRSYSQNVRIIGDTGKIDKVHHAYNGYYGIAPCICLPRTGKIGIPSDLNFVD